MNCVHYKRDISITLVLYCIWLIVTLKRTYVIVRISYRVKVNENEAVALATKKYRLPIHAISATLVRL